LTSIHIFSVGAGRIAEPGRLTGVPDETAHEALVLSHEVVLQSEVGLP
jgi:hypothetical protein